METTRRTAAFDIRWYLDADELAAYEARQREKRRLETAARPEHSGQAQEMIPGWAGNLKRLAQELRCERCGKLRIVNATRWRGHGTGVRGARQYDAAGTDFNPDIHCTCHLRKEG